MKILHVDDEPKVLEQAKIFLEKNIEELKVETATSTGKALKVLEDNDFDALVSDYQMPEMDGLEFLEIVREEINSDIPFIIFTGKGREEVAMEALNRGADRYLQKRGSPKTQYGVLADAIVQEIERWNLEKKMEKALRKRAEVERRISEISSRYAGDFDFDEITNETLADIGQLVGASRAYLFLFREDGERMDNTHEWCEEGVSSQMDNLQGLSIKKFPWWMEKLKSDEIIHVRNVSNLPDEAENEKEILEIQNIKSVLALPVFQNDELVGFIGFDNVEKVGEWSDEAIFALRIISKDIGLSLEQKEVWRALQESEKKYRILSEGSSNGIYLFQNGGFKYVNQGLVEMSGYSREELKNMNVLDLVQLDDRVDIMRWTSQALEGDTSSLPEKHEVKVFRKDGDSLWVRIKPSLVEFEGEPAIVGNVSDISDRKGVEKKLRRNKERLEKIFESAEEGIIIIDFEGMVTEANGAAAEMIGYEDSEELVGKNGFEFVHPEDREKAVELSMKAFEEEKVYSGREYRILTEDGEVIHTRTGSSLLYDDSGDLQGTVNVVRDITEEKQRRAEERKARIVNSTAEGIVTDVLREFETRVTASHLGLQEPLEYMADLATAPSSPQNVFNFMITGIQKGLTEKGVEVEGEEIRDVLAPHMVKFFEEVFPIKKKFGEEPPEEYANLKKELSL